MNTLPVAEAALLRPKQLVDGLVAGAWRGRLSRGGESGRGGRKGSPRGARVMTWTTHTRTRSLAAHAPGCPHLGRALSALSRLPHTARLCARAAHEEGVVLALARLRPRDASGHRVDAHAKHRARARQRGARGAVVVAGAVGQPRARVAAARLERAARAMLQCSTRCYLIQILWRASYVRQSAPSSIARCSMQSASRCGAEGDPWEA